MPDGDQRLRSRRFPGAVEPVLDVFDISFAECGIARTKSGAEHRVRFRDPSQDGVVAGAAVIARIAARHRSFLVPEQRHHRRVDIDGDARKAAVAQQPEPLLGDQRFEAFELFRAEPAQVVIERIDTRHRPAGQVLENRIGREPLEIEDPPRPHYRSVDQEPHLRVHRIDDLFAGFEIPEVARKTVTQPLALHEGR
jgi:hypothetical protein